MRIGPEHQAFELSRRMKYRAIEKFGHDIRPCYGGRSIEESYTIAGDSIQLWFNASTGSTHMIRGSISRNEIIGG